MSTLLAASVWAALAAGAAPGSPPGPAARPAAGAAARPAGQAAPVLRLSTSVSRAAPGDAPSYRVRLVGNLPDGAGALRVGGVHTGPWTAPAATPARRPPTPLASPRERGGDGGDPAPVHPPRLVVEVPTDGALELRGSLAEIFPDACRGGCETGTYELWASVRHQDGASEAARRGLPLMARARITVTPVVVAAPPAALRASIEAPAWERPGTVRLRATIRNVGPEPVWVPGAARLAVGCHARIVGPDNTRLLDRHAVPRPAAPPWSEREGTRLAPGASVTATVRCGDLDMPPASRAYLRVRLRPVGAFVPRREARAAYLATPLLTEEVRVR